MGLVVGRALVLVHQIVVGAVLLRGQPQLFEAWRRGRVSFDPISSDLRFSYVERASFRNQRVPDLTQFTIHRRFALRMRGRYSKLDYGEVRVEAVGKKKQRLMKRGSIRRFCVLGGVVLGCVVTGYAAPGDAATDSSDESLEEVG